MTNGVNKLLNTMSKMGTDTVSELSYGTVTSLNPLVITRETGESRTPLTAEFLVLSKMCKEFRIISAKHYHVVPSGSTSVAEGHLHGIPTRDTANALEDLLIWPGLRVGEKVILLSFSSSQKFFVERMEVLENEVGA